VDIGEPDEKGDYYYTDTTGKRKKVTDSAKYKALGNSIALPFWRYLARRIVAQYEHEVTMGSLFSGIGGFELVFSQCGAKPLWNSEIESFPNAVTKQHFGDGDAEGDLWKYLNQ
jgi:DNA (cytosine-5)-methyltransferase 1